MVCKRCGTVFCWDQADVGALGGSRAEYCSDTCKGRAREKRKNTARQVANLMSCGAQGKEEYPSAVKAAAIAARAAARPNGPLLWPYRCACGSWHLTTQRPTPRDLARLAAVEGGRETLALLVEVKESPGRRWRRRW